MPSAVPTLRANNDVEQLDPEAAHVDSHSTEDKNEMPNCSEPGTQAPTLRTLPILDRFLTLFILIAIILGLVLGAKVPSFSRALNRGTFISVPAPIAAGLIAMLYPILCGVRYETLHKLFYNPSAKRSDTKTTDTDSSPIKRHTTIWTQLLLSIIINWIIAPLLMLALSWAFLPDRPELRSGLIFVGIARCIAMVMIWIHLAGGDSDYGAVLVAVNSLLQLALFAPLAVFYVRIVGKSSAQLHLDYAGVAKSVAAFLGIPLGAALITRFGLIAALGRERYDRRVLRWLSPLSLIALLYTIIVLFGSQGDRVATQIVSVVRVAAPLLVYFAIIFGATAFAMKKAGYGYGVSAAQSFTAASNNFELAIAVVVSVYGPGSQQALASTVGPLIEVPVLLGLVYVLKWVKVKYGWKD